MPQSEIQAQQIDLTKDRIVAGNRFYVLYVAGSGHKMWSGPYPTRERAEASTAMRDQWAGAFILEGGRYDGDG